MTARFEIEKLDEGWIARFVAENGEMVWRTVAGGRDGLYESQGDARHAIDLLMRHAGLGVAVVTISPDVGADVAAVVQEHDPAHALPPEHGKPAELPDRGPR